MNKVLTVSIAAYNVSEYLPQAIESLVEVSPEPIRSLLEVIIVNDGSTDNTVEIAKKYCGLYPDIVKLIDKANGGYGSTINSSLKIAQGKYFKQLDGDDWFISKNIANFISFLQKTDADLVVSPFYKYFEKNNSKELVDNQNEIPSTTIGITDAIFCGDLAMHALSIKTEKARKLTITENCFYTDNEYTMIPLLDAKTIARFAKPIYCYRIGREGQSISLLGAQKHYKDTMRVADKLFKLAQEKKALDRRGTVGSLIELKLLHLMDMVVSYYLVSNDIDAKAKVKEFDQNIRGKYPEAYNLFNRIKKVKLLRLTNYHCWKLLRKVELKKWN